VERVEAMYRREPSFTNLLPWLDYDPQSGGSSPSQKTQFGFRYLFLLNK
jgi:hypothetical protein